MSKLREWRKARKLKQYKAAEMLGVSATSWSRYESGKKRPTWHLIAKITKITEGEVTANDFVPKAHDNRDSSITTSLAPAPQEAAE